LRTRTAAQRIAISWRASSRGLSEAPLRRALAAFLAGLGYPAAGLDVVFAGDALLRRLNARHRGRDAPTDILSFSYLEPGPAPALLGVLAVSLPRARRQARGNGWEARTEVLRLLAHGCAHLAGYDHATAREDRAMRRVEEGLLERVGVRGLYPPAPGRPRRKQAARAAQPAGRACATPAPARRPRPRA
jgi:probable rRNA maturation factor